MKMSKMNGVIANPKGLLQRLSAVSAAVFQKCEEDREQRRLEAELALKERGQQAKLAAEAAHASLVVAEATCSDYKSQLQVAEQVAADAVRLGLQGQCRELEDIQFELSGLLEQALSEQTVLSHVLDAAIDNLQSLGLVFSIKEEKQNQATKTASPTALKVFLQGCKDVTEGYQLSRFRNSLKEFEGEDRKKAQGAINSAQRRLDEAPALELIANLDKSLESINSSRAIELKKDAKHMLRQGDFRSAFEKAEEATLIVDAALKIEEDRTRRLKAEASKQKPAKKKD